eukprot:1246976-Amphidinium_carterae.1
MVEQRGHRELVGALDHIRELAEEKDNEINELKKGAGGGHCEPVKDPVVEENFKAKNKVEEPQDQEKKVNKTVQGDNLKSKVDDQKAK